MKMGLPHFVRNTTCSYLELNNGTKSITSKISLYLRSSIHHDFKKNEKKIIVDDPRKCQQLTHDNKKRRIRAEDSPLSKEKKPSLIEPSILN